MYDSNRIDELFGASEESEEKEAPEGWSQEVPIEMVMLTLKFLALIEGRKELEKTMSITVAASILLTQHIDTRDGKPTPAEQMIIDGIIDIAESVTQLEFKMEAMSLLLMYHERVDKYETLEEFFAFMSDQRKGKKG